MTTFEVSNIFGAAAAVAKTGLGLKPNSFTLCRSRWLRTPVSKNISANLINLCAPTDSSFPQNFSSQNQIFFSFFSFFL